MKVPVRLATKAAVKVGPMRAWGEAGWQWLAVGLIAAIYALVLAYMVGYLGANLLQFDVLNYAVASERWREPVDPRHVPGFPLAVALARGLSFGLVPTLALQMSIALLATLGSGVLTYQILRQAGARESYAAFGALLLVVWPFLGIVYVVYPLADSLAVILFLSGLYALLRSRVLIAALIFGLALITHKVVWVFVGFVVLAWLLDAKNRGRRELPVLALALVLPLAAVMLRAYSYYGDPLWLLRGNLGEIASFRAVPAFDGIVGAILHYGGGLRGVGKAIVASVHLILAGVLLNQLRRSIRPVDRYGAAIAGAVVLMCVVLDQSDLTGALRFGRLLALPIMLCAVQGWVPKGLTEHGRWVAMVTVLGLVASQFAYAWYFANHPQFA